MVMNQVKYVDMPVELGEKVCGKTALITGMLALHHMLVHLTNANCMLPNPFLCI